MTSDLKSMEPNALEAYERARLRIEIARKYRYWVLDLIGIELTALPPEIGDLSGDLTRLSLQNNNLTKLPPEIGNLAKLTELQLGSNKLKDLPPEIGKLTALTSLDLENNQLCSLPAELDNIPKLFGLRIFNNQILFPYALEYDAAIPILREKAARFHNFSLEEKLRARENELRSEAISPAKRLLDFYFSRLEHGEHPLNEVKLLLLGRGEAGKTSISRALRGEHFDKDQEETPGIEIKRWKLECGKDDDVTVHLWDFAGQEITHETHRYFLTDRSLYVVVLDGRGDQQMEDAEYWLSHVERYGTRRGWMPTEISSPVIQLERSPVIVVLNKWESPGPYEIETRRLLREYPNIVEFVKTDCGTDFGIDDLENTIRDAVGNMPSVRQNWPKSYFDVRQDLLEMTKVPDDEEAHECKYFLTWTEFRDVCSARGVTEAQRQHSMAENLNSLGVALYYGDDARLRDTRVLDPNWAANGLYGIIRGVNKIPYKENEGHLLASNIDKILVAGMKGMDEKRGATIDAYPLERDGVNIHEFLLDLMVERELAFQAGTVGKAETPLFLLPGLLPLDEPEPEDFDIAKHMEEAQVRFRYLYELLPPGVMSRLIVRTHSLSEGLFQWKNGVVIEWQGSKALVIAETRKNPRIEVYIRGGTSEIRQALAGIIRTNMATIHNDLPEGLRGGEELDLAMPGDQYEKIEKLRLLEKENKPVQVVTSRGSENVLVSPELDQVEPKSARSEDPPLVKIFVSYSHANYEVWGKFKAHLDAMKNAKLVDWWFDGKIRKGSDWDDAIRSELKEADIIVFLVSTPFFASSYIQGVEIKEAKRRHEKGEAVVLPVFLETTPSFFDDEWMKTLQAAPSVDGNLKPINKFSPHRNGWVQVDEALREIIADRESKK